VPKIDAFDLPVHPQADIYPMLPADEMQELAQDIKINGLNNPIVVGEYKKKLHLIDGRNRREACRIAGVEPTIQHMNGEDQVALIVSSNLRRRNMTKSQAAMAMAVHYPEPEKGGRGKRSQKHESLSRHEQNYLSMARTICRILPEMTTPVLAGAKSISEAYEMARKAEKEATSDKARMESLRDQYPALADLVDTGQLSLSEAEASAKQREAEETLQRELKIKHFYQLNNAASLMRTDGHLDAARDLFKNHREDFESYTKQSLADFFAEVEVVARNISLIRSIIKENI
jgi:hypothetical protein